MRRADSSVGASGFSTIAWMPASARARAVSSWKTVGAATIA